MNHLEQLISEWYEYNNYFVKRNIKVGPRPNGGYECELDVVAFNPETKKIIHLEPSSDADSWEKREKRYLKKFNSGKKYIPNIFPMLEIKGDIEQIAVFLFASRVNHKTLASGRILLVADLMVEISNELAQKKISKQAVPEQYPLLRTIQLTTEYRNQIYENYKANNFI